jgi:hypothetical protein
MFSFNMDKHAISSDFIDALAKRMLQLSVAPAQKTRTGPDTGFVPKICKYGIGCKDKENCSFAHCNSDTKPFVCKYGARCIKRGICGYAHPRSQQTPRSSFPPCRYGDDCRRKEVCKFSHKPVTEEYSPSVTSSRENTPTRFGPRE